jgi:T-complex protein 1 subunit theta|tara:strand:+ start:1191 stop:2930 length:1740 start_codon:yes stop_codon:yes gene_type:complete
MSGLDEAVIKNVEACKQLSKITRTSLGPNGARSIVPRRSSPRSTLSRALSRTVDRTRTIGQNRQTLTSDPPAPTCEPNDVATKRTGMNKMVINHLDKLFVTSDAAVIVRELEVAHPAAKLLVMAAQAQEQEIGDGTNLVVTFGGELLGNAEELIRDGLHPSEIIEGYEKALEQTLKWLEELVIQGSETLNIRDKAAVAERLKGTLSSKQFGYEELLAKTCAEACIDVCPKNQLNFNVDNVRVSKIIGSSLHENEVVQGMVIRRDVEGTVKHVKDAKVAVFGCAVDTASTETKGTIIINNASDLESYSKGEEQKMEEYVKMIADSGAKVVVSGQSFGEMALHFIERYGLMAIKMPSKFELRRFCRATNAVGLIKLARPAADELGYVSQIDVKEIGGTKCVVVQQNDKTSRVATVVLRGSTENVMDDIERAVDDGVNAFKALTKDSRTLPAGGATEIELAHRLAAYGRKQTGLDQYAIEKFSKSLEVVPRTLAENAGLNATDVVYNLYAAHAAGETKAGVDVSAESQWVDLAAKESVADVFLVKWWALKLAVEAVCTVLRVDQIIMAKQAGGPKHAPGDED